MAASLTSGLTLVALIALTAPFWVSAFLKTLDFPGAVEEAKGLGLPLPSWTMAAVIALQAFGSLGIILNVWAWLWVAGLALFTLTATFTAHSFWRFQGLERKEHLNAFLANAGLIGGLILSGLVVAPVS